MNRKKITDITIILLLVASFNFLALGTIYYVFENNIENFKYSDTKEFSSINDGLSLINTLPIQFNILNEYFSGFDNLPRETRESILMAYLLKNKINTYPCGSGKDICIDKNNLNSIAKIFNTKTEVNSNNIRLYIDDYGNHNINSTSSSTYYRVVLDDDNHNYRKYSKFAKYKEENDLYIFYLYEGYYRGNCVKGDKLELFDFISGEVVYTSVCDDNQGFEVIPMEEVEKLQLYKYELKKDENGDFYLYGYNPVNH